MNKSEISGIVHQQPHLTNTPHVAVLESLLQRRTDAIVVGLGDL